MRRKKYENKVFTRISDIEFLPDVMHLSELIGSYRTNRGISQEDMAKAIGISRRSLTRLENNEVPLSLGLLFKMAAVFHVRPIYILDELNRITKRKWDQSEEELDRKKAKNRSTLI